MSTNVVQIEEIFCAGGSKLADSADLRLLVAQFKKPDAFKSEYLSNQEKNGSQLLKVRSLMFRGHLVNARLQLDEIDSNGDQALQIEVKVETARVECFEGSWSEALRITQDALSMEPSALNRLTLHQIRGTAFFATNDFASSLQELEIAQSFEPIFPDAQSGFYIRVLEARLQTQLRGPIAGRHALNQLWQLLNTQELNRDHLLSLLRAEIELSVIEKKSALDVSIACFIVSKSLGDLLYTDLALVDCYAFADDEIREYLKNDLDEASKRFKRVEKELLHLNPKKIIPKTMETSRFECAIRSSLIAIPRLGLVFYPDKSKTLSMDPDTRLNRVISAATEPQISKQVFFNRIWGNQQYSARLHDGILWTTLSRLRNKLEVTCKIKNDAVIFENLLVLNDI